MDIYLTYLQTGDTLRFPMLPEKLNIKRGNEFASYTVLTWGDVKIPSGSSLDEVSWSGLLPGYLRKNDSYIKEWIPQLEVYKWLESMKCFRGGVSKKMRLLVTGTPINMDVYLQDFSGDMSGGLGDFFYDISLVQARDLIVTSKANDSSDNSSQTTIQVTTTVDRSEPPSDGTYTVVQGDFLWAIAQKFYGDGSKYGIIYAANQTLIDSASTANGHEKYTIYPGQVFMIP